MRGSNTGRYKRTRTKTERLIMMCLRGLQFKSQFSSMLGLSTGSLSTRKNRVVRILMMTKMTAQTTVSEKTTARTKSAKRPT